MRCVVFRNMMPGPLMLSSRRVVGDLVLDDGEPSYLHYVPRDGVVVLTSREAATPGIQRAITTGMLVPYAVRFVDVTEEIHGE